MYNAVSGRRMHCYDETYYLYICMTSNKEHKSIIIIGGAIIVLLLLWIFWRGGLVNDTRTEDMMYDDGTGMNMDDTMDSDMYGSDMDNNMDDMNMDTDGGVNIDVSGDVE